MIGLDWLEPIALLVLAFVTLQRLLELVYARQNESRLRMEGAQEYAPGHYPAIVVLHAAWLLGLWVLAIGIAPNLYLIGIFAILQALRVWVLLTLGRRWTTRIFIMPGETLVAAGPYRFIPHPNYAVVIGEIFILPMAFGLFWYAALFSLLNGIILYIRIRAENAALEQVRHA